MYRGRVGQGDGGGGGGGRGVIDGVTGDQRIISQASSANRDASICHA